MGAGRIGPYAISAMPADVRKAFGLPAIGRLRSGYAQFFGHSPTLAARSIGSVERFGTSARIALQFRELRRLSRVITNELVSVQFL